MDRRDARAERETTRAELALPIGEVAAARAVARRLGQIVFSIADAEAGTRRLAFEPPDDRWALAYAVDPTGTLVLGPAAPAPPREPGEPEPEPDAGAGSGPSDAARAAGAASVRHRRRTLERLQRRAVTLEGVARVDERSWAGVDRLVPESDRRGVRTFALSGVSGGAVAARLMEIIARELTALDAETGDGG